MSAPAGYSGLQKALHWGTALLILGLAPVGLYMTGLPWGNETKNRLYELHKSFGLIVASLVLVRVAVRLRRGAPPLELGIPAWQRRAAHASHAALYGLLVLVPLLGWAGTSACCAPVNLFWTLPLTLPVSGGMDVGKAILAVHGAAALLLVGVVAVHAAAALQHHWLRRDATLLRMLPGRSGVREHQEVEVADEAGEARRRA
jgi:cytochrome b561